MPIQEIQHLNNSSKHWLYNGSSYIIAFTLAHFQDIYMETHFTVGIDRSNCGNILESPEKPPLESLIIGKQTRLKGTSERSLWVCGILTQNSFSLLITDKFVSQKENIYQDQSIEVVRTESTLDL